MWNNKLGNICSLYYKQKKWLDCIYFILKAISPTRLVLKLFYGANKKNHITGYEVPKMEMYLTLGNIGNEKLEARVPNELQPIS